MLLGALMCMEYQSQCQVHLTQAEGVGVIVTSARHLLYYIYESFVNLAWSGEHGEGHHHVQGTACTSLRALNMHNESEHSGF